MADRFSLDLRDAIRRLAAAPGFTLSAVVILTLGIGANTALFSAVDALAFRPRPFVRPHELVNIYQDSDDGRPSSSAYPAYLDIAAMTDLFSGVGAVMPEGAATLLTDAGDPSPVRVEFATSSFLPVLGLRPARGRWFAASEDHPGAAPAAVLSHTAWKRRFNADPDILGRTIRLNGAGVTVVGVGSREFESYFPGVATDMWLSISALGPVGGPFRGQTLARREDHWFQIVARLRPGGTVPAAQGAMNGLADRLGREFPETDRNRRITVTPASRVRIHPDIDRMLYAAVGVPMLLAGLVLVVACSNLANLLLARGAGRRREFGVRLALGATRAQLVRMLLAESAAIALAAGLLGLAIVVWSVRGIEAISLPVPFASTPSFDVDGRVLLFAILLALATGVASGLWPALRSTRRDIVASLRDSETSRMRGLFGGLLSARGLLVALQLATSLPLLAGGGLLVRSMLAASHVQLGFEGDRVAIITVDVGQTGRRGVDAVNLLLALRDRIAALPGVSSTALASRIPLTPVGPSNSLFLDDRAIGAGRERGVEVKFSNVTPEYFATLGIPLRYGRFFTDADRAGTERVAIVTEAMARRYWGVADVVNRSYRHEGAADSWVRIVGVVGDVPIESAGEKPSPFVYRPYAQRPGSSATILVRSSGSTEGLIAAMRNEARAVDPLIPVFEAGTMAAHVERSLSVPRTAMQLLVGVAALAVLLACVGLYSVVAFAVSRRRMEMTIRMAVGASPAQVTRLVIRDTMSVVALGILCGLFLATLLAPALSNLLVGIRPLDGITFLAVTIVMALVALVTTWVPARRAGRGDLAAMLKI